MDKTRSLFQDIRESLEEERGSFILFPSYGRVVRAYRSTLYLLRESFYNIPH